MTAPAPASPSTGAAWSARDGAVAVLAAQIALIVGGSAIVSLGGWGVDDIPIGATLVATLPFWAAIAVAAVVLSGRHGVEGLRGRWPRPLEAVAAIVTGAVGQLVVIPVAYSLLFRFTSFDSADLEEPARRLGDAATGPWGALALVVLAGLGAPLFEEVLYRGVLLPPLVGRLGEWGAIAVSGAVFAVFHFQALQLPGLFLLGAAAGWFRVRRGGVVAAVLVHASFNAVTLVELLG